MIGEAKQEKQQVNGFGIPPTITQTPNWNQRDQPKQMNNKPT